MSDLKLIELRDSMTLIAAFAIRLDPGGVVDVEFILGETAAPKPSLSEERRGG